MNKKAALNEKISPISRLMLLKENPDSVHFYHKNGKLIFSIGYRSINTVCTGAVLNGDDNNSDYLNHIVGVSLVNNQPFVAENDPERKKTLLEDMTRYLEIFKQGTYARGHYGLEDSLSTANYFNIRFRIFEHDRKYYFSCWEIFTENSFKQVKPFVDLVLKLAGIDTKDVLLDMDTPPRYSNEFLGKSMQIPYHEFYQSSSEPVIENELTKEIDRLSKEISEKLSDLHVKGAQWTPVQKNQKHMEIQNLQMKLTALKQALASGETSLEKVVISTIDKIEDNVPADRLYAELEQKLKSMGSSAVQILQKLKDMKVDPKKMLKTIHERCKNKKTLTSKELIEEIRNYITLHHFEEIHNVKDKI